MLEAKFPTVSLFKKLLDSLTSLIDEASFDCSSEGLTLQAMDSSHVALVSVNVPVDVFEHFRCDRNLSIAFNLRMVAKILKHANNDDWLTVKAKSDDDIVTFVIGSRDNRMISEYGTRKMDLDVEHLGIPETDYDAVVKLPSLELQRVIRDLSVFGESVTIAVEKEGISFSTTGDLVSGSVKLAQSPAGLREENAVVVELKEATNLTFALKYLGLFTRSTGLSTQAKLSVSEDVPLILEYGIGNTGYIRYYLAPKMEEHD